MDDDDMKPEVKEGTRKGKNRTCIPLANRVPHTHTPVAMTGSGFFSWEMLSCKMENEKPAL